MTKIAKAGKLMFAGLVVASAAFFKSAIQKAADFELGMAKVKAITGANADEFDNLTLKAKELGLETAQTMTDIAAGMEAFARAGFEATEIVEAMDGAVALAESQVMDLADAVEITGTVLRGMQLPASEAERVANALAATASSAAVTVSELGESMKYLAPVAAALGLPLEEALTVIGKLGDAGLKGGRATRALSTALESLADPTDEAADALERLGIDTFDAEGNFIGIIELVGQLETSFKDLGYTAEEQMAAMSAIFAGSAGEMNILIGVGQSNLEKYQDTITGTTVAFDQQKAMLETVSGQWDILKGSIELLMVTIGSKALPIIQRFMTNTLIPWVNRMTDSADGTSIFEDAITKLIAPFQWMIDNGGKVKTAAISIATGFAAITAINMSKWVLTLGGALSSMSPTVLAAIVALAGLYGIFKGSEAILEGVEGGVELVKNKMEDLSSMLGRTQSGMGTFANASKSLEDRMYLLITSFESLVDAEKMTQEQSDLIIAAIQEMYEQVKDAPDLSELLADGHWDTAINNILSQWTKDVPELEKLIVRVPNAVFESTRQLTTSVQGFIVALAGGENAIDKWNNAQSRTKTVVAPVSKAIQKMADRYTELKKIMDDSPLGSIEYVDALREAQDQYNFLIEVVEYLDSAGIEVNETIIDHIALLEEGAIVTREMMSESERLAYEQERLADANERLYQSEHGLLEETLELLLAYDQVIDGGAAQADILDRLSGIYDEVVSKIETLGDAGITASGDLLLILETLKTIGIEGPIELSNFERTVRTAFGNVVEFIGETIGDIVQGFLDLYRQQEQELEDHNDRMLQIEEDYVSDQETALENYQADQAAEQLAYDRLLEDMAREHERAMANAHDYDAQQQEYIDYQYALEDAKIEHDRRMTDLETSYTNTIQDLTDDRIDAIAEEEEAMEGVAQTKWEMAKEAAMAALTAAKEELLILAIVEGIKGMAYAAAAMLGGAWAAPLAAQHTAVAAGAAIGGTALVLTGFKDGAMFDSPTMLPPHMVAEGGSPEAYIPLTKSVLGKIGEGIVAAVAPEQPMLSSVGAGNISIDMRGMYDGATLNVRSETDIELIAQEHYSLFKSRLRSDGVRI